MVVRAVVDSPGPFESAVKSRAEKIEKCFKFGSHDATLPWEKVRAPLRSDLMTQRRREAFAAMYGRGVGSLLGCWLRAANRRPLCLVKTLYLQIGV
jgi:hypothetical protein